MREQQRAATPATTGSSHRDYTAPTPPTDEAQAEIVRLAGLSAIEYDQQRVNAAKTLGIRVSTLDTEVDRQRQDSEPDGVGDGIVEELDPWDGDVDGAAIAETIRTTIHRYCVLSTPKADAITLWIMASYGYRCFLIFPRLLLSSPTMRCGKTTVKNVVEVFANKPVGCESISPAVLFRIIEKYSPTLLLDEADTYLSDSDDLRGIVNSGHLYSGRVLRCVGDTYEPMAFSTYGPMLLAFKGGGLLKLPDTIKDRSIGIELERKLASQTVQRIKPTDVAKYKNTRRKILRWVTSNENGLRRHPVNVPDIGNDRAIDNWLPLLAVADALRGDWPDLARVAMQAIESIPNESDDYDLMLLADICGLAGRRKWRNNVSTSALVSALNELSDRPWPTMRNDRGISAHVLSRHLKNFHIRPGTQRDGKATFKGYDLQKIRAARDRYLPTRHTISSDTPKKTVTPSQRNNHAGYSRLESVTLNNAMTDANTPETVSDSHCDVVTVQTTEHGQYTPTAANNGT